MFKVLKWTNKHVKQVNKCRSIKQMEIVLSAFIIGKMEDSIMFKGFYGWSLENVNKGTVETKYIIEYINDKKTWNKFLKSDDPDLYNKKEYDNISDALTFYFTWYINENCYDIKMWEQVFVNGEMVLEQIIETASTCKFSMRQSINREMENRMREAERRAEELEKSNEVYKKFLDTIDCGQFKGIKDFFRLFLKEYTKLA